MKSIKKGLGVVALVALWVFMADAIITIADQNYDFLSTLFKMLIYQSMFVSAITLGTMVFVFAMYSVTNAIWTEAFSEKVTLKEIFGRSTPPPMAAPAIDQIDIIIAYIKENDPEWLHERPIPKNRSTIQWLDNHGWSLKDYPRELRIMHYLERYFNLKNKREPFL